MEVIPYKQSLSHSCLVACFLMIHKTQFGIDFTEEDEQRLALKGSRRIHPFYVAGVPIEIAREFNKNIVVYVDNKFFTSVLDKAFTGITNIRAEHKPAAIKFIRELLTAGPVICHIDTNALGDYSHSSHFIVVKRSMGTMFLIVDPWTGTERRISEKTLEKAIAGIKKEVKMCPLLFTLLN